MNPTPSKYSMYHVYLLKIGRAYSQLKNRITTGFTQYALRQKKIEQKEGAG
jgi:hypothetical protein